MKKHCALLVLVLSLAASSALAQSTYNGEFIFSQGDFREFDILGSGPVTGGVSGNNLVITSSGGSFTYQNSSNSLDWSVSFDKNAAANMASGTGVTNYSGSFTYGKPQGPQSVIGAGQLNGANTNGVVTLKTYNGRMGVNGVNPANTTTDDWNTANFNWWVNIPAATFKQWLGQ